MQIVRHFEGEKLQFLLYIFAASAHEALDGVHGALGRFDQILAGRVADYDLIIFIERNDRGHEVQAVVSRNYYGRVSLHVGHERVRGAEIDADDVVSGHC